MSSSTNALNASPPDSPSAQLVAGLSATRDPLSSPAEIVVPSADDSDDYSDDSSVVAPTSWPLQALLDLPPSSYAIDPAGPAFQFSDRFIIGIQEIKINHQALEAFLHTAKQRSLLVRLGSPVYIAPGSISLAQLNTHRPSYVNAVLIQYSGEPCPSLFQ
jgi:hypothetical protein